MPALGMTLRHLVPGTVAIGLASAILLISDLPRRPRAETAQTQHRVALFQIASQPILEDGAAGVVAGLEAQGYVAGRNLKLSRYNAEGDLPMANVMAQELAGGQYDLVISLATACLQAMANANQRGAVRHVFGMVSDPVLSGVGIGDDPLAHPPHMVGIGTLPPADQSFELAKQVFPDLQRVGVVWNPAEINSEVATKMAREVCKTLDIELLEANAENTAAVREAAASLIARDVQALWVGGDVTVLGAIDVVIHVARQAKIPVFTCIPGNSAKGTLFDIGANYYEVGRMVGRLGGRVLDGESIATIPWERAIPPKLFLNTLALEGLKDPWVFPAELLERADSIIDASGERTKSPPAAPTAKPLSKQWRLRLASYINSPDTEDAERGVRSGLEAEGLVEGRDFEWKSLNAQGEMATLNGLIDAALADRADLILTVSTQALQAAVQRAKEQPIVFTMVANPFLAEVATSDRDHLPRVTGAYGSADAEAMMPVIRQLLPGARRLGTLYSPTEVNSVYNHEILAAAVKQAGWELVSVGVNTPSEVPDATQSLCTQEIDAVCLTNSNLAGSCFPSIVQAARRSRTPVFTFLGSTAQQGAVAVLTRDYFDMGQESGRLAARVMRGADPAAIPLEQSRKNRLLVNLDAAREWGVTVPAALIQFADEVIGK
jgi:ABC-type uncharacterized transport system substrate-binding protein